jgi:hypothetical protein
MISTGYVWHSHCIIDGEFENLVAFRRGLFHRNLVADFRRIEFNEGATIGLPEGPVDWANHQRRDVAETSEA